MAKYSTGTVLDLLLYSTVRAVQYSAVQYSTVQYSTVLQYIALHKVHNDNLPQPLVRFHCHCDCLTGNGI